MSASMSSVILSGIAFLISFFNEAVAETCSESHPTYLITYRECSDGCCGYFYDRECCNPGILIGVIVGCVLAFIILIVVTIVVICICKSRPGAKGTVHSLPPGNAVGPMQQQQTFGMQPTTNVQVDTEPVKY